MEIKIADRMRPCVARRFPLPYQFHHLPAKPFMAVDFKDYYQTLGVPRTALEADIRKAFRKLAREHHPDVAKDKKAGEAKFKEIGEAYDVLSDPEKRKRYDEMGPGGESFGGFPGAAGGGRRRAQPGGGGAEQDYHFGGTTGFSDFFEQFFSGGASRSYGFPPDPEQAQRRAGPRRGGDIEGDILVTLEEAMHGTMRQLSLQTVDSRTGAEDVHTFTVRIPAGASEGRRIRVPGQGAAGHGGGEAGDLFLRVRIAPHPDFRVRGSDLYHDLDLAPWEAVLGAQIVVPSLDGAIKVRIPEGTENAQQLRVRGRGLPVGRTGERGDLFVVANLLLPTELNAEERALWEKLRETSKFQPRTESARA